MNLLHLTPFLLLVGCSNPVKEQVPVPVQVEVPVPVRCTSERPPAPSFSWKNAPTGSPFLQLNGVLRELEQYREYSKLLVITLDKCSSPPWAGGG